MPSNALRLAALAALALLVFMIVPVAMAQDAPAIEEFKLPADATSIDAMCLDSQGNVWLAQSSPAVLYKFDRSSKTFETHEVPAGDDALFRGMSAEGSEYIWIADQNGEKIYGYDIDKNKFYNFTWPSGLKLSPSDVVSDGKYLYIACNMELGRIDIDAGSLKDYYVDKYTANLAGLARDRIGNVWFVESSSDKIGGWNKVVDQYDPDHAIQIFSIPTADANPTALAVDSLGRVWFIESGPNKLGMFDTSTSSFKELDMPVLNGVQVNPKRIAVDGDDNIWLTDMPHGRVIKYYPSKDVFMPAGLNGTKVYPTFVEADADNIWIFESGSKALAMLQTDPMYGLTATPTPTPTPTPMPSATPTPKPAPGFEIMAALGALVVIAKKAYR